MYIHEAVKKALEKDGYVVTREFQDIHKMKPTNTMFGCIAYSAIGNRAVLPGWQPTADELMRDDYMVLSCDGLEE